MKTTHFLSLTFILTVLSFHVFSQKNVLPKQMTDYEKTIMNDYLSSFDDKGITTPPPYANIRTAAEWEEVQALVITWTNQFNSIQKQIVDADTVTAVFSTLPNLNKSRNIVKKVSKPLFYIFVTLRFSFNS